MSQEELNSLDLLPTTGRLLGIDLGTKTIGLAISDGLQMTATPAETIKRKKFGVDAEQILKLIDENQIVGIVIGLPLNMDGSEGPRVQSTRAFVRNFLAKMRLANCLLG